MSIGANCRKPRRGIMWTCRSASRDTTAGFRAIRRIRDASSIKSPSSGGWCGMSSGPLEERRFALRFLIHLIEDLHMPLHVGDNGDKGGNRTQVRFFDKGTNMHRLWDSDMIERVSGSEEFWLDDLADTGHAGAARGGGEGNGRGVGDGEPARGAGGVPGAGDGRDCLSPGRSWRMRISRRICRWRASGSTWRACGWRGAQRGVS